MKSIFHTLLTRLFCVVIRDVDKSDPLIRLRCTVTVYSRAFTGFHSYPLADSISMKGLKGLCDVFTLFLSLLIMDLVHNMCTLSSICFVFVCLIMFHYRGIYACPTFDSKRNFHILM